MRGSRASAESQAGERTAVPSQLVRRTHAQARAMGEIRGTETALWQVSTLCQGCPSRSVMVQIVSLGSMLPTLI
jgi:hypothetical protein